MTKELKGGIVKRKNVKNKYIVDKIEFEDYLIKESEAVLFLKYPVPQVDKEFETGEELEFEYSNTHEDRTFNIIRIYGPTKLLVRQM